LNRQIVVGTKHSTAKQRLLNPRVVRDYGMATGHPADVLASMSFFSIASS